MASSSPFADFIREHFGVRDPEVYARNRLRYMPKVHEYKAWPVEERFVKTAIFVQHNAAVRDSWEEFTGSVGTAANAGIGVNVLGLPIGVGMGAGTAAHAGLGANVLGLPVGIGMEAGSGTSAQAGIGANVLGLPVGIGMGAGTSCHSGACKKKNNNADLPPVPGLRRA